MIGIAPISLSGCLGSTNRSQNPSIESSEEKKSSEDSDVKSSSDILQASLVGSIPDGAHVVEDDVERLMNDKYISKVLEEAYKQYEDGMEDDLGKNEDIILASVTDNELTNVENYLESGSKFVNYNGVPFLLMHYSMSFESDTSNS
ncbi:hypothetical protein [Natrinema pallidum]|uniref:Uncharacterized protein n=1 Tax=Natrinema pallidum TaxID=69527 RepID=A0A4P9TKM9_9EURY|nr:hypothetical protein [Natrinema pallidum]QCW04662.1 hypothetical protein FGF80_16150 [Natrinema pallidum]